jgi:hypothetical protein
MEESVTNHQTICPRLLKLATNIVWGTRSALAESPAHRVAARAVPQNAAKSPADLKQTVAGAREEC